MLVCLLTESPFVYSPGIPPRIEPRTYTLRQAGTLVFTQPFYRRSTVSLGLCPICSAECRAENFALGLSRNFGSSRTDEGMYNRQMINGHICMCMHTVHLIFDLWQRDVFFDKIWLLLWPVTWNSYTFKIFNLICGDCRDFFINYPLLCTSRYFLAVLWFGSSPTPFPPLPVSKVVSLSQSSCVCRRSSLLTGEEGRVWGRSQITWLRESLALCKSFNTLMCPSIVSICVLYPRSYI